MILEISSRSRKVSLLLTSNLQPAIQIFMEVSAPRVKKWPTIHISKSFGKKLLWAIGEAGKLIYVANPPQKFPEKPFPSATQPRKNCKNFPIQEAPTFKNLSTVK